MCIIIVKPKDVTLDQAIYERCMNQHADGAGFSYVLDGKLHTQKGFFKFKKFYESLKPIEDLEMIIHFRNASPGMVISGDQCHPFVVVGNPKLFGYDVEVDGKKVLKPRFKFAIFHNGRLDYKFKENKSDTNMFVDEVLEPQLSYNPFFLEGPSGRFMLGRTIGSALYTNNKMAIMRYDAVNKKSDVWVINPLLWTDDHKCMFSNDTYKPPVVYSGGYGGDSWGDDGHMGYLSSQGWHQNKNGAWTKDEKATHVSEKERSLDYLGFYEVDDYGWVWSQKFHMWRNIKTGCTADKLKSRPTRPPYADLTTKNPIEYDGRLGNKILYDEKVRLCANPHPLNIKNVLHEESLSYRDYGPKRYTAEKQKLLPGIQNVTPPKVIPITGPDGKVLGEIVPFKKDIEVPRSDITAAPNLDHLSQSEKKTLRRMACDYCRDESSGYAEAKFTQNDAINLLRFDLKNYINELKEAPDPVVDRWVLDAYKLNPDVVEIVSFEMVAQKEAEDEARIKALSESNKGPTEEPSDIKDGVIAKPDQVEVPIIA